MECAQEVEDIVNADPTIEVDYVRYYDVYIVDYNRIVVDLDDSEGNEFSGQAKIDMRRIRRPQDLITKYAPELADQVIEQIHEAYGTADNIEESENISADWRTENPMVIDSLWPDDEPIEANDVKGILTIDFVEYFKILKDGDWEWLGKQDGYEPKYTNEYDDTGWYDEETGIVIFRDEDDVSQFMADEFDDELYTRLPNVPGVYKISGILEVPYVLSDLQYTSEDREEYVEDCYDLDIKASRYTLSKFKTTKIK